jgi:hypothetical protein
MNELQSFQTLVSHLLVRLRSYDGEFTNSSKIIRTLENHPHHSMLNTKGFFLCLSLDDSITEHRQNDDYLDGLFMQLLSF